MDDALRQAIRLATNATIHESFGVWTKDNRTFVDNCKNMPQGSNLHYVVQRWDDNQIQIRGTNCESSLVAG